MLIVSLHDKVRRCMTEQSIPSKCTCTLIVPYPKLDPVTPCQFEVEHISSSIDEESATFDEKPNNEVGLPPKFFIPSDLNEIRVRIVHRSNTEKSLIVNRNTVKGENTRHFFNKLHW